MTFVGPPFTDNENWTFHPIQTLFNISTYNNIYEPIVKRDYENIYNGFLRFIPRFIKRLHPKPFSKILICLSISILISFCYFTIVMVLRELILIIPKLREKFILYFSISKKEKKFYKELNKEMENVDSLKPLSNYDNQMFEYRSDYLKDPSIYNSPLYADFHYPILCHDQQEYESILHYIYIVPEKLNKILGGQITIQILSKLVNDELKKQNLYNGNDFTIRCPIDLGIFRNIHPDSLFNLVKMEKIKIMNFCSNPFIITVKNITKKKIKIYFPKGSIIESIENKEPCIVTKEWITEIMPNETETIELQCNFKNNEPPDGNCLLTPFVVNANANQIKNYWKEMKNLISPTSKDMSTEQYDINYYENNKEEDKIQNNSSRDDNIHNNSNNDDVDNIRNDDADDQKSQNESINVDNISNDAAADDDVDESQIKSGYVDVAVDCQIENTQNEQMEIDDYIEYLKRNPMPGGNISPEVQLFLKNNQDKVCNELTVTIFYHHIPIKNEKTCQYSSCTRLKYGFTLNIDQHLYLIEKDEKSNWKGRWLDYFTDLTEKSIVPSFYSFNYLTEISIKEIELALLLDEEEFDYENYNSYHSITHITNFLKLASPIMIEPFKLEIFSVPIDPSSLIQSDDINSS